MRVLNYAGIFSFLCCKTIPLSNLRLHNAWDLKFLQHETFRIQASEMWQCIVWWIHTNVSGRTYCLHLHGKRITFYSEDVCRMFLHKCVSTWPPNYIAWQPILTGTVVRTIEASFWLIMSCDFSCTNVCTHFK
jgi:hypothetical protein